MTKTFLCERKTRLIFSSHFRLILSSHGLFIRFNRSLGPATGEWYLQVILNTAAQNEAVLNSGDIKAAGRPFSICASLQPATLFTQQPSIRIKCGYGRASAILNPLTSRIYRLSTLSIQLFGIFDHFALIYNKRGTFDTRRHGYDTVEYRDMTKSMNHHDRLRQLTWLPIHLLQSCGCCIGQRHVYVFLSFSSERRWRNIEQNVPTPTSIWMWMWMFKCMCVRVCVCVSAGSYQIQITHATVFSLCRHYTYAHLLTYTH